MGLERVGVIVTEQARDDVDAGGCLGRPTRLMFPAERLAGYFDGDTAAASDEQESMPFTLVALLETASLAVDAACPCENWNVPLVGTSSRPVGLE
jgi:hypothetical protein